MCWATVEYLMSWLGRSRAVFGRKRGAASSHPAVISHNCIAVCRAVAGRDLALPSSSSSAAAELRLFGNTVLTTLLAGALIATSENAKGPSGRTESA